MFIASSSSSIHSTCPFSSPASRLFLKLSLNNSSILPLSSLSPHPIDPYVFVNLCTSCPLPLGLVQRILLRNPDYWQYKQRKTPSMMLTVMPCANDCISTYFWTKEKLLWAIASKRYADIYRSDFREMPINHKRDRYSWGRLRCWTHEP